MIDMSCCNLTLKVLLTLTFVVKTCCLTVTTVSHDSFSFISAVFNIKCTTIYSSSGTLPTVNIGILQDLTKIICFGIAM